MMNAKKMTTDYNSRQCLTRPHVIK